MTAAVAPKVDLAATHLAALKEREGDMTQRQMEDAAAIGAKIGRFGAIASALLGRTIVTRDVDDGRPVEPEKRGKASKEQDGGAGDDGVAETNEEGGGVEAGGADDEVVDGDIGDKGDKGS